MLNLKNKFFFEDDKMYSMTPNIKDNSFNFFVQSADKIEFNFNSQQINQKNKNETSEFNNNNLGNKEINNPQDERNIMNNNIKNQNFNFHINLNEKFQQNQENKNFNFGNFSGKENSNNGNNLNNNNYMIYQNPLTHDYKNKKNQNFNFENLKNLEGNDLKDSERKMNLNQENVEKKEENIK